MEMSLFPFDSQCNKQLVTLNNGSGYDQPVEIQNVSASLVSGTGVNDSFITANIHVLNGFNWNGGSLDRTSTSQNFVYAFSPKKPSSASGDLYQHVTVGNFQMDMTAAIGAGGVPTVVSPSTSWGWSTTVLAHAVIMGLAWIGGLLSGAVIIRFLDKRFKNPAFVHQYLQLASFGFVFIAFFIGVGISLLYNISNHRRFKGTAFQIRSPMAWALSFSRLIDPRGFGILPPPSLCSR